MTINKRAGRSIKKNKSFYIISIILTALTSMIIVAAVSTGHTLTSVVRDFVDEYKAEDAEFVTYKPLSEEDIDKLEKEYDVILEYSGYKDIHVKGGDLDGVTIRAFAMPEKLNLCDVREGHEPGDGEALLTQDFADVHNIKIGDEISLGDDSYKVSAYTTKADYIYMLQTFTGFIDNEKFAAIVVDRPEYDRIDTEETGYYSIKYNKDNSKEVREKLNSDYIIASYMAVTTNTRISMPVNEGDAVTNMATMFAPVMFVIVLTLIVMVLGRNIKNEQYLLGTFISLGFSRKQIIGHYVRYGLIPGVVGSVLGVLVSIPLTKVLCRFYIEYDFETLIYKPIYDLPSVVIALVVPTLLYCAAIAIQAGKLLKKAPVDLLRNTGKDTKAIGIMKNSRAKTQVKMRVRSVMGHPGRSIVTTIGVAIAAFCIVAGLVMSDSMDALLNDGLTSSIKYEYLYRLNTLQQGTPDEGEALFQNYYEVDGSTVQLSAQGIETGSKYFPDKTDSGEKLELDKYYLTSAAAETFGMEPGEELIFYNIADLKEHKVKISGVVTDNTHCYLYTGRDNATELAGVDAGTYNCIISKDALTLDKELVASETKMTVTADTMDNLMGPMKAIILMIEIVGIVLGVFVLYLIINMIVSETSTNISVMKVLGFNRKEISNRVLNVNHVLVCIGYLLGIPMAYTFVKVGYSDTMENYGMLLSPVVTVKAIVTGFLLTWVTYELSLLLQKRKISRIDMVEALKENSRSE
ncbi:predicted ABC-type transport system involved in lysophospholipase L1 biosynthesis permease component [Clostridium sp. CAG:590]|nr:predicted ABC-type transport system involved in lysophospholipase L1 biosynthesis permease component [Clostridium sp. CAG:590]